MGNDVGREAGRKDLMPRVWGKLRLIDESGSSWGWRSQGEGRRKKAKEEEFKSSLVKGPDIPHDKTKIIGDLEPG